MRISQTLWNFAATHASIHNHFNQDRLKPIDHHLEWRLSNVQCTLGRVRDKISRPPLYEAGKTPERIDLLWRALDLDQVETSNSRGI